MSKAKPKASLKQIFTHSAAIDIGATHLHVSTDGENVHVFETFTVSIIALIKFLLSEKVTTVAIEATGVLWIPLFDMLEGAGLEVVLVNPVHVKNVPAQKTDFNDCRWLWKVHSYGLLRPSFVPPDMIRELRSYIRMREDHIEHAAGKIQQMQKAFELMNIKLHHVISDLKGVSGLRIVEAILAGETDALRLVEYCDKQILKKKRERVIASLQGNYKKEYLFLLRQAYEGYQFFQQQVASCDKQAEGILKELTKDLPPPPQTKSKPASHNNPNIEDLHEQIVQLCDGRDATVLPGLIDKTILKLHAELGTDLSHWETEKHFSSWAKLSPWRHQSGKTNRTKQGKKGTRVGQIFREAAMSIANSKHLAMKGFYYRVKKNHGHKVAIKATARKLAVLYYRFMTKGLEYVERGLADYEERYKEKVIRSLHKRAKQFGLEMVPIQGHPGGVH